MRRLRARQGEALAGLAQTAAYGLAGFFLCLLGSLTLLGLDALLPAGGVTGPTLLLTVAFVAYLVTQWILWQAAERWLRPDEPFAVAAWATFLGTALALAAAFLIGRLLPHWRPDRLLSLLPVYLVAPVFTGIVLQVASGGPLRLPRLPRRKRPPRRGPAPAPSVGPAASAPAPEPAAPEPTPGAGGGDDQVAGD